MRRSSILYIIGFVAMLPLVFGLRQAGPRRYIWDRVSLAPNDDEPFGTQLFDCLMKRTLPAGYESEGKDITEWERQTRRDTTRRNVLITVNPDVYWGDSTEIETVLRLAKRGDEVMIAGTDNNQLVRRLGFRIGLPDNAVPMANQAVKYFRSYLEGNGVAPLDKLSLPARKGYPGVKLKMIRLFGNRPILRDTLIYPSEVLATSSSEGTKGTSDEGTPVAVKIHYGKGSITLVTALLPFTNYGITDESCRIYAMRLMNELKGRPVVRLYQPTATVGQGGTGGFAWAWLSFIADQPPLLWAWQLFVVGAVLLLTVNARRRQRAIPVWGKERNSTIELLTQHASLYRNRTDHRPLFERAYRAFAARLMREWHVDVADTEPVTRRDQASHLARYLGRPENEVAEELQQFDALSEDSTEPVSPTQYRRAMELMKKLAPKGGK